MIEENDYYKILGVSSQATAEEIKKAYHTLAKKYHPDLNPGTEDLFKKITEAYNVLSDPKQKAQYDLRHSASSFFNHQGSGYSGHRNNSGSTRINFEELFINLANSLKNLDIKVTASITLEQAYRGDTVNVDYTRYTYSNALKTEEEHDTVTVDIPRGAASGTRIKFPGRGHNIINKKMGNLIVIVNIQPHKDFSREGNNILYKCPISVTQAALGGKVTVPTLDGTAIVRIPPGCQPGTILRLKNKGMPILNGDGFGNELIETTVKIPTNLSAREKELFTELGKIRGEEIQPQQKTFSDYFRGIFG